MTKTDWARHTVKRNIAVHMKIAKRTGVFFVLFLFKPQTMNICNYKSNILEKLRNTG